jgi:hypothetical protein
LNLPRRTLEIPIETAVLANLWLDKPRIKRVQTDAELPKPWIHSEVIETQENVDDPYACIARNRQVNLLTVDNENSWLKNRTGKYLLA